MTDLNNDEIPDRDQPDPATGGYTGAGDAFSRAMNDPGIRRGVRVGGRIAVGWLVFSAIMFVIVLTLVIIVFSKVLSNF